MKPVRPLSEEIDAALLYERRKALRALLQRPLITADGPDHEIFVLIRRHAVALREWLARNPGWSLQIESEVARLRKTPANLEDGTRPARDPKKNAPFSRRRYVLLCLTLAALEQADRQITLGRLADEVVKSFAGEESFKRAGLAFDLKSRGDRRDLVDVVRLLLELGVLRRVHGEEEQYLRQGGDVLYNVRRPTLAVLLNVRRAPSTIESTDFEERLRALVEEPFPETDTARNRRLRSYLSRRLLDDPWIEFAELDDEALAYLHSQRSFLMARAQEFTGLEPEVRKEGIAMVDERGELADFKMFREGTNGHLTLLVAEFLAQRARRDRRTGKPIAPVAQAVLESHVVTLIKKHQRHWRGDVKEPGAEIRLTALAVERLAAFGLVRETESGILPRPAIARYAFLERRSGSLFEQVAGGEA